MKSYNQNKQFEKWQLFCSFIKVLIVINQLQAKMNKTKYFRLQLTDKVSSERPKERPKRDLGLTWDWLEHTALSVSLYEEISMDASQNKDDSQ